MNLTKLKTYAPLARTEFIRAVSDKAGQLGLSASGVEPVVEKGEIAIVAGRAFPSSIVPKRRALEELIERDGFDQTMEAVAYTWFNRFVAIRFMELHGYLEHGYRVLSNPDAAKTIPQIIEQAELINLPGLDRDKVVDLKLDGNKDAELYKLLLLGQCHALHEAMPFLFPRIDDETELLLPDNLLHSDSVIRTLVRGIDEEDWKEVEIIGWLYQFYISERKDQVMARKSAVPTEDIPAVTQLFTPHWIVRYLVENSLGRLWLLNRPNSKLRERMPYYIEGEAESEFLKISTPEEIRIVDPAVGSGHMLTYAFDLLYLIYLEDGYTPDEIPSLILLHNLHGLDICPRAAQLAELALVFKAREKSHRFFQPANLTQPHVLALQNVRFGENELRDYVRALGLEELFNQPLLNLLHQFEEAKNFGSLIQPCLDERTITTTRRAIEANDLGGHLFLRETHFKVLHVLEQAEALTQRYHIVVANPPYMAHRGMNSTLRIFMQDSYEPFKTDLFAAFISRGSTLSLKGGRLGYMSPNVWMFILSHENLRRHLLNEQRLDCLVELPLTGFTGATVQICAFCFSNAPDRDTRASYIQLTEFRGSELMAEKTLEAISNPDCGWHFKVSSRELKELPGSPLAYWVSSKFREAFRNAKSLGALAQPVLGMTSSDNNRFLRRWFEPSHSKIGFGCTGHEAAFESGKKWFPYNKGGEFRKWYGNNDYLINWEDRGREVLGFATERYGSASKQIRNQGLFFKPSVTWSFVNSAQFGVRRSDAGFIFDVGGSSAFPPTDFFGFVIALLCSSVAPRFLKALNPTLNFQAGNLSSIPLPKALGSSPPPEFDIIATESIQIARADWDNFETSWDFRDQPLLRPGLKGTTLEASWKNWEAQSGAAIRQMQELETENNRLFIDAYGLADELTPEVPVEQITLARAEVRRDIVTLLSYAIGCMMGRYSLDEPGLVYAQGSNEGFDPLRYSTFPADQDGIIPIADTAWFADDAAERFEEFIAKALPREYLEVNLKFIADSLEVQGQEHPRDTIRRYLSQGFYGDHLKTYKKRPIYWLFSSGKQKAFQCLVYLHRYNEGTLARMRTEYVIPLQGKYTSRIDQLADEIEKASATSHRKKLEKERDKLLRQQTELLQFDEKLRHYAEQRISLDLDDGVKVNYGKFGDLLAEVKAITGGSDE